MEIDIRIKLKIKDIEIELTEDEAKQLKDELNRTLGQREKIKEIRIIREKDDYWPWWRYPVTYETSAEYEIELQPFIADKILPVDKEVMYY